jgi:hypothetical protein
MLISSQEDSYKNMNIMDKYLSYFIANLAMRITDSNLNHDHQIKMQGKTIKK